jgi:ABC-type sugar transport system ATPase subunit
MYLFDEPTAALGVEQQANVNHLIEGLKDRGSSVILVNHNVEHVFEVATRSSSCATSSGSPASLTGRV